VVLETPSAVDQSELDSHIMLDTLGSVGLITDPSVRWRAEQLQPAPGREQRERRLHARCPVAEPVLLLRNQRISAEAQFRLPVLALAESTME
jgi:hypothetical protein